MNNRPAPVWTLAALVLLLVVVIAALVTLEVLGLDESVLLGFVAAPVSLLIVLLRGEAQSREQLTRLDQISEQTNGALDERIRKQVRLALADYDEPDPLDESRHRADGGS